MSDLSTIAERRAAYEEALAARNRAADELVDAVLAADAAGGFQRKELIAASGLSHQTMADAFAGRRKRLTEAVAS